MQLRFMQYNNFPEITDDSSKSSFNYKGNPDCQTESQLDFYAMLNPQQQDPLTQRQTGTSSKSFM